MKTRRNKPWLRALVFLVVGAGFYIYFGIEMHAWKENLPNLLIYLVIVAALWWALWKKQKLQDEREQDMPSDNDSTNT